jgi:hypothetical protein
MIEICKLFNHRHLQIKAIRINLLLIRIKDMRKELRNSGKELKNYIVVKENKKIL